jgi:ABC-type multidrug transport system permease subunit
MIFLFFKKRLREFLRNKKILILKLILPSILLLPLFFLPANVYLIAGATTFFITFFGFFTAGEGLGRERLKGTLQKIAISPAPAFEVVLGEIFFHSLFLVIQFLPILLLILIKVPFNLTFQVTLAYLISFFCTVLSVNALGILLLPIFAEIRTTIFLLMIFPLMVFSGIFVPLKSWIQIAIAKFLPPAYLYQSILLIFSKESIFSSWEVMILSLFPTLFILVLTLALSKKIIR